MVIISILLSVFGGICLLNIAVILGILLNWVFNKYLFNKGYKENNNICYRNNTAGKFYSPNKTLCNACKYSNWAEYYKNESSYYLNFLPHIFTFGIRFLRLLSTKVSIG